MSIGIGKRALVVAAFGLTAALPASQASATSDREEIRALVARLKQLEAKVAKQEHEQKETKAAASHATNVANAANAAVTKGEPAHMPPMVTVAFKNGLFVETVDHAYSFKIGGRIMVDGGGSSEPETGKAGNANIRRARLEVEGRAAQYFFWKEQYDFAGNNTLVTPVTPILLKTGDAVLAVNPVTTTTPLGGMRDLYMGVQHPWMSVPFAKDPLYVMVGSQYEPASIEMLTSSKYIDFIERALPTDAFAANRHIGLGIGGYGDNWSAKGGVFTTSFEDKALAPVANMNYSPWGVIQAAQPYKWAATGGAQYFDIAGRATYAPIKEEHSLLHFGGWGRYHVPNDSTALNDDRVMALGSNLKSEANILNENLVGTPDLSCGAIGIYSSSNLTQAPWISGKCVKDVVMYGAEVVGSYGPFSVQAEYSGAHYNRDPRAIALASFYTLNTVKSNYPAGSFSSIDLVQPQNGSANFDGYYVYGTWYLTGEERSESYNVKDKNSAAFEQIKIKNPVSQGGWGALEAGLRFSSVNLNSGPFTGQRYQNLLALGILTANNPLVATVTNSGIVGGRQQDLTAGLNWYPEKGFRVMANWTRVMTLSAPFDRPYLNNAHPNLFMVRTQVDW